jgi:hypothetical protein
MNDVTPITRNATLAAAALLLVVGLLTLLSLVGVFDFDVWERDAPLLNPIAVTGVHNGTLMLADGRTLRPAGVRRIDGVSIEDYDRALRVMTAQGVVVLRDLGDGSAFLLSEPRFYNWSGTRNYKGNAWARWGGSYLQCPLSELLIQSAYAESDLDQSGLTARERWRLEGVRQIGVDKSPTRISEGLAALRYDGNERFLRDYDAVLEMLWTPPPSP